MGKRERWKKGKGRRPGLVSDEAGKALCVCVCVTVTVVCVWVPTLPKYVVRNTLGFFLLLFFFLIKYLYNGPSRTSIILHLHFLFPTCLFLSLSLPCIFISGHSFDIIFYFIRSLSLFFFLLRCFLHIFLPPLHSFFLFSFCPLLSSFHSFLSPPLFQLSVLATEHNRLP